MCPASHTLRILSLGRLPRSFMPGGGPIPLHAPPLPSTAAGSLSLDSGASLDSFIASDDELEGWLSEGESGGEGGGGGGEGDWRAALREATGGCVRGDAVPALLALLCRSSAVVVESA